MKIDRFTRNAIVAMIVSLILIVIGAYLGSTIYGGDMETAYVKVMEEAAHNVGKEPTHLIELSEDGEYIAFTIAGCIGGLIVGYLWPIIFSSERRDNDVA